MSNAEIQCREEGEDKQLLQKPWQQDWTHIYRWSGDDDPTEHVTSKKQEMTVIIDERQGMHKWPYSGRSSDAKVNFVMKILFNGRVQLDKGLFQMKVVGSSLLQQAQCKIEMLAGSPSMSI